MFELLPQIKKVSKRGTITKLAKTSKWVFLSLLTTLTKSTADEKNKAEKDCAKRVRNPEDHAKT